MTGPDARLSGSLLYEAFGDVLGHSGSSGEPHNYVAAYRGYGEAFDVQLPCHLDRGSASRWSSPG